NKAPLALAASPSPARRRTTWGKKDHASTQVASAREHLTRRRHRFILRVRRRPRSLPRRAAGHPGIGVNGQPGRRLRRSRVPPHPHAVEMGIIAAANATAPDVRSLGYDIALPQETQIGIMQTWLSFWGLTPTSDTDQKPMAWMPEGTAALKNGLMPGMATQDQ